MKELKAAVIVDDDYTLNHRDDVRLKGPDGNLINSLAYIGRGYDVVNGVCFDADQLKARVFTAYNNLVTFNTGCENETLNFDTVYEKAETSKSIGAAMKMNLGIGIFKGEVKASFDQSSEHEENMAYTCASYVCAKGCEDFPLADAQSIKNDNLLTPAFKEAINNPQVSPQQIVNTYGTHVMANGVVHGARLNFYLSTSHSKNVDKLKLKAAIQASFGAAFKGNASATVSEEYKDEINATSCTFVQVGGDTGDSAIKVVQGIDAFKEICKTWKASLSSASHGNNIASVGSLIGLWEFADDADRKKELELYITGHLYDSVEYHPIAMGIVYYNVPEDATGFVSVDELVKQLFAKNTRKSLEELSKIAAVNELLRDSVDGIKIVYPWMSDIVSNNCGTVPKNELHLGFCQMKYIPYTVLGNSKVPVDFDQNIQSFEFKDGNLLPWNHPEIHINIDPSRPHHGMPA